jgi:hypothetical protein
MMNLDMKPRLIIILFLLTSSFYLLSSPTYAAVKLEQYISITNQEFTATQSAVPTDNSLGLILWDQDAYSDEAVYFEAIIKCDSCTGGNTQATATLYTSGGSAVTDTSVSTTNSGYTLVRTGSAITGNLADDTQYTVRLTRDADTGTAYLIAARLVVIQSAASALTATQSQLEIGSVGNTTNTSLCCLPTPKSSTMSPPTMLLSPPLPLKPPLNPQLPKKPLLLPFLPHPPAPLPSMGQAFR